MTSRTEQLDKQINLLIEDSVGLLKTRMTELGINSGFYTKDLLDKAKEIILRHRELQAKALKLQCKVRLWQVRSLPRSTAAIETFFSCVVCK